MTCLSCCARAVLTVVALFSVSLVQAQEKSQKFAHISFPDEVKYVAVNDNHIYTGNLSTIWIANPRTLEFDELLHLDNIFTHNVQGIAAKGNEAYTYICGAGIYKLGTEKGTSKIVCRRDEKFVRNYEEAYSAMSIDPLGEHLLLYGQNENAVVFKIHPEMTPIVRYDNHVSDAYWLGDALWAACLDKVVLNNRKGKSLDNQDFINYGENDQTGMIKFRIEGKDPLPNMGETDRQVFGSGELIRLIYNKGNGDLLLCLSTFGHNENTQIFKLTPSEALPIAEFKGYYGDFAAFGSKIIARTGSGFVEVKYGTQLSDAVPAPSPIVTDLRKPVLWKGHKPDMYKINGSSYMDFDESGNLWIAYGRDIFVKFKQ